MSKGWISGTNFQMKLAAERMCSDYENDKELTIFTQLDGEDFKDGRFMKYVYPA
jgi:heat shock protein HslJ